MEQYNIESPFWNIDDKFEKDIEFLRKKYGFSQIFIAYEVLAGTKGDWTTTSNTISHAMVEVLESAVDDMKGEIENAESN
jgi:hypothetical protein